MNIWTEIPSTNGNYSANKIGQIKSNDKYITYSDGRNYFVKGRILIQALMTSGYSRITFSENQKKQQKSVSRIIADLFISNPNNLPCVCHKNDIKTDNRVENLFWGTQKDNIDDMIKKGRRRNGSRKLTIPQVLEIKKLLGDGITQSKIGSTYNISQSCISEIKLKKSFKEVLV